MDINHEVKMFLDCQMHRIWGEAEVGVRRPPECGGWGVDLT